MLRNYGGLVRFTTGKKVLTNCQPKLSQEDYDADSVAGNSDAEVTGDTTPAVEQRSGLHCGANKPLEPEENGATVATREPESRKVSLWAFFLQGTEKGKKKAKCTVEGCKTPVVMAQATSIAAHYRPP